MFTGLPPASELGRKERREGIRLLRLGLFFAVSSFFLFLWLDGITDGSRNTQISKGFFFLLLSLL